MQDLGGGGWPYDGSKDGAPPAREAEVESLEDLPPVNGDGEYIAVPGFGELSTPPVDEQVTLRGIFLTDGKVDVDSVVAHFSELPGIENCIVLGNSNTIVGNTPGSAAFGEQAARLHASLDELSAVAGAVGGDSFTISTSSGMVSFFGGDGMAIGVKHDPRGFRPGVRERLTVVARELGKLVNQS